MRVFVALLILIGLQEAEASADNNHHVYGELFGKAGIYGLGYEYSFSSKFSLGLVSSFDPTDDEILAITSSYLGFTFYRKRSHRWFAHLGPSLVYRKINSPVPEWSGSSETKLAGQLSLGYERGWNLFFIRGYAMVVVGEGGVAPWAGLSTGVRF